jgi:hypothetical protein
MSAELEAILYQGEIGDVPSWASRFDLSDYGRKLASVQRIFHRATKILNCAYRQHCGDPSSTSDSFQIRTCAGRSRKAADGQQALIIEYNMYQVPRPVASHRAQTTQIHQKRTIAIKDNYSLIR